MGAKRTEKGSKGSYDLCDIAYRYPCLTCQNGEVCKICNTDCKCKLEEGCADCVGGKRFNTQIRPLYVMMHDIVVKGGLRFSPDPKMFGSGGIQVSLGEMDNNPSYKSIFGDSTLFENCEDGVLIKINQAALMAVRRVLPSEFPKDSDGSYMEIDKVVRNKRLIKQHITMPLSESERTKERKGVSEPSKYFNISYNQSKDLINADLTRVSATVRAKINKMIDQKNRGISSREIPVGTYTFTDVKIAVEDKNGEIIGEDIERYTMLKGKNFTADLLVCYPSMTFNPKLSVKETIRSLLITDWSEVAKTSIFDSKDIMNRIVLNEEQKKRNKELLTYKDTTDANDNAERDDETTPADSAPPTPSIMTPISGAEDIQEKFERIKRERERVLAIGETTSVPLGFDTGAMRQ